MPDDFEENDSKENLNEPPAFFPYEGQSLPSEDDTSSEMIEVQIEGIFGVESDAQTRFVLLSDGIRKLPIRIGAFESQAILYILEGDRPDRPMTHDLFKNVLDRLEATLDRVAIDDFWSSIYYAKMYLHQEGVDEELEIDARPSDAIAMAVRFNAPIFVANAVFDASEEI